MGKPISRRMLRLWTPPATPLPSDVSWLPQPTPLREAGKLVRMARRVYVAVSLGDGRDGIIPVPKSIALKMLREARGRTKTVLITRTPDPSGAALLLG